jgi:hypothetical protein
MSKIVLPLTYDDVCTDCARKGEAYAAQITQEYGGYSEILHGSISTLSAIIFEMEHRKTDGVELPLTGCSNWPCQKPKDHAGPCSSVDNVLPV